MEMTAAKRAKLQKIPMIYFHFNAFHFAQRAAQKLSVNLLHPDKSLISLIGWSNKAFV